jgi:aconitate hydratase
VDIDLTTEPLGRDGHGEPVYLRQLWPEPQAVRQAIERSVSPDQFARRYADVDRGPEPWRAIEVTGGERYEWKDESTYIQHPPFFQDMTADVPPVTPVKGARVLALLGDSVTTDHISPAGSIAEDSPAGRYLKRCGMDKRQFNSYGSRRGNHEVMMRGTFANIRVRNHLAPGTEGGWSTYFGPDCAPDPDNTFAPDRAVRSGEVTSIYDAATAYQQHGIPLLVLAGSDYGMGSSRDWAAKGTQLLGVRAVLAASYERIHRSNLVGMGVLPLEFTDGEDAASLELTGAETFDIPIDDNVRPGQMLEITATDPDSAESRTFQARVRIDTPVEVDYYRHGGILHTVLRKIATP